MDTVTYRLEYPTSQYNAVSCVKWIFRLNSIIQLRTAEQQWYGTDVTILIDRLSNFVGAKLTCPWSSRRLSFCLSACCTVGWCDCKKTGRTGSWEERKGPTTSPSYQQQLLLATLQLITHSEMIVFRAHASCMLLSPSSPASNHIRIPSGMELCASERNGHGTTAALHCITPQSNVDYWCRPLQSICPVQSWSLL